MNYKERLLKDIEEKFKIQIDVDIIQDYYWQVLEEKDKEIERLNKKIEQYENPEDMTLMFMWCDEKAKDEIKRLNNIINEIEKELNKDFNTYMTGNRQNGKIYKAGANNYRMHIYLRFKKLKGEDKE